MTHQRKAVLEAVRSANTHPTADEVYAMVRRRLPRISLGTVYRNLDVLSESGAIRKLELGGSQKRFDGNTRDHYHIRCVRCGRVDDVPVELITVVEDAFRDVCGYQILGHQLVLTGLCPTCRGGSVQEKQQEE